MKKNLKRRNHKEFQFERAQKSKLATRLDSILVEKKNVYAMKIEGMISQDDYFKEKNRLLMEEKQIKDGIQNDGIALWTKVMEETLDFAANVTKIFSSHDIEVKRQVLRILGSNLVLKDRQVQITGKKAFIFLKEAEGVKNGEKSRLEPENSLITRDKIHLLKNDSDMERVRGIEPPSSPWKGDILPLYYTRTPQFYPPSRKTSSVSWWMEAKKFRFGGISLPTKRQGEDTPGVSPWELHLIRTACPIPPRIPPPAGEYPVPGTFPNKYRPYPSPARPRTRSGPDPAAHNFSNRQPSCHLPLDPHPSSSLTNP